MRFPVLSLMVILVLIVSGCTQTGYLARDERIADDAPQEDVNHSQDGPSKALIQTEVQSQPQPDPCDLVICENSVTTCPDGFVASCINSCSGGTCSSCTPGCEDHQRDPCADVTCQPSSETCPDGFFSVCGNSCSEGQCSSCQPDCSGHSTIQASAVIINEIMYNPTQNENYNEWVELFNPSGSSVSLEGWALCNNNIVPGYVDKSGNLHQESGSILESHAYAVITDGGSGTEVYANFNVDPASIAVHVDGSSLCGGLTNAGRTIELKNQGQIVDSVTYSSSLGANGNGKSLEKSGGQWIESSSVGGTPGR